jgi:regulator of RNase E activity RraA
MKLEVFIPTAYPDTVAIGDEDGVVALPKADVRELIEALVKIAGHHLRYDGEIVSEIGWRDL